jgi:hypothetical protein
MGRPRKLSKHEATGELKPITSIYELMGKAAHPYSTLDVKEYEDKLQDMNLADLQDHAIQLNIVPVDDRERLQDKLITAFLTTVGIYEAAQVKDNGDAIEGDKKAALDILSRGR